jgi:hypothetical protein
MKPDEILNALSTSAERVIAAMEVAPDRAAPEWSPAIVLGHLADVDEQVWQPRIALMVQALKAGIAPPTFAWWEPDSDGTADTYIGLSVAEAAEILRTARNQLITDVATLTDADWFAKASHDTFGTIDIAGVLMQVLEHDAEHCAE